jgi:hypothetical protein
MPSPFVVTSVTPPCGTLADRQPPYRWVVSFSDPPTPGTIAPSNFRINGVASDSVSSGYLFNSSPVTVPGSYNIDISGLTRLSDGVLLTPFACALAWSPTFVPAFRNVPCIAILGSVTLINAALRARYFIPEPFLRYLSEIHLQDTIFPDGYIGHEYLIEQTFDGAAVVSLVSGAMPPGIGLAVIGNVLQISGTPTTLGTYDFTLRFQVGIIVTDYLNHITILADPDGGSAFAGGV